MASSSRCAPAGRSTTSGSPSSVRRTATGGGSLAGAAAVEGMPGFGTGNSAPGYPRSCGGSAKDTDLEPVASARGWYAQWTGKVLGVPRARGRRARTAAVQPAAPPRAWSRRDHPKSGAQTFHLPATSIVARAVTDAELAAGAISLSCSICRDTVHGPPERDRATRRRALPGRPLRRPLRAHRLDDNFYRQMYAATDIRRVVAREHTSLLEDEIRLAVRDRVQGRPTQNPNAPNVLVATPTLEMGIDIGDLSAVMLSSLPRTVASYLQRVGRAGRLTGNALALALRHRPRRPAATIRPTRVDDQRRRPAAGDLPRRRGDPAPPVHRLGRRLLARRPDAPHPRSTPAALRSTAPGTYLGELISQAETHADALVDAFLVDFHRSTTTSPPGCAGSPSRSTASAAPANSPPAATGPARSGTAASKYSATADRPSTRSCRSSSSAPARQPPPTTTNASCAPPRRPCG